MHCYKEYHRTHKDFSSIAIDATGKFVRKIVFPDGEKSQYIFLYQIIINFDKNSQSVWQMLSAAHDAETIRLWLVKWVSLGARHPREAVSDGSRVQLNAMSSAFNLTPLKTYIAICFKNLHRHKKTPINTYIRLDAAHFVHSITGWKYFKSVLHPSIKQFYIRCICLLIDCTNLDDFQRILLLILVI
ncbi:GSCOCG00012396001-RA-CDS, partial [Cotesia congregata]